MKKTEIIICDDDTGILNMLDMVVQSLGVKVVTEQDSSKLYHRLQQGNPQLLIIDLWMPSMPGELLIKKIKADKTYKDLYILCISASQNGREIAMDAGADEFLAKPFDLTDIIAVVNKIGSLN